MVASLKTAALSSLLFASSCANLASAAVVQRGDDGPALVPISREDFPGVINEKRDSDYLKPISQDDFSGILDKRESDYLKPISQDDFSGIAKRGDGTEDREFTPITGVQGGVVERMPIGQLRGQQPDVFNMLTLALDRLMKFEEDRELSWFKLAGIHGLPFEPWQYPDSATVNPGLGYCTHSSSIFLTWHRPYLLLIEVLYSSPTTHIILELC